MIFVIPFTPFSQPQTITKADGYKDNHALVYKIKLTMSEEKQGKRPNYLECQKGEHRVKHEQAYHTSDYTKVQAA